ncbi:MAG: LTA synthase family protein [Actinomycetota bacterium]|nr:LTA synthase family protein [Actinomycetota bacterium]
MSGFAGRFLGYRDWVYLCALLVPFVFYNLLLRASQIASQRGEAGLSLDLGLMRSAVFFSLGYALLWIGLFAVAKRGPLRWAVVGLFHATTVLVVIVTTTAHQYFLENGTTLNYGTIAEWLPKFQEIIPILTRDIPPLALVLLAAALLYAILGPWFVMRAAGWWRGWPRRSPEATARAPFWGYLGFLLLAVGFGALSLTVSSDPAAGIGKSFARDPFVNVVLTGVQEATAESYVPGAAAPSGSVAETSLTPTSETEKRNVVLIHLESTRAQSVTPYNKDLETTPFLDELARSSLLAERAYTTVPRSSKASVSVNCGVEPPLYPGPEFEPGGVPARCLATLLKDQGYRTAFFASTLNNMDNFGDVAKGFGYEEIYPAETMNREGFQVTNTFGYEDDIMLEPSEEWLRGRGGEPFMVEYFTGTGHYGYECSNLRTGFRDFVGDEELNRYLNCMPYLDSFVENIFDQYKKLGLYEDTIFVIFGDHGEGFGEHGRYLHGDTIYEEGIKIPLLIHDPKRFQEGERVEGLSNQIDILPTVLDMLGYEVEGGEYPGFSLLRPLPEDRTQFSSCITDRKCMASIRGDEKYIYHYDDQPDEVFDLSEDPQETNDLADRYTSGELESRRRELLEWSSGVDAFYSK